MAKNKIVRFFSAAGSLVVAVGRWIGARRALFVWSAVSAAIALYFGLTTGIGAYVPGAMPDLNMFVFALFVEILKAFVKVFVPILILVIAMKYVFDFDSGAKSSETFRLSAAASVLIGLFVGAFYYYDASQTAYCVVGNCIFKWAVLEPVLLSFLVSSVVLFTTFLGLRGIYTELTFMFGRKK